MFFIITSLASGGKFFKHNYCLESCSWCNYKLSWRKPQKNKILLISSYCKDTAGGKI